MISKKDYKRFIDNFDSAFEDIEVALESMVHKTIMMQVCDLTGDENGKGVFVEVTIMDYELDGFMVTVGFIDPLNNNVPDVRYLTINDIAREGEW
ncbi:hypothetical protein BigBertha_150 [Bacillus phage BigBertha]|uniref:Uncharacterized protein n=5 Tax=Caudoviricetes TaxID=2731619 RepID=A0A075M0F2_9CAUD|nr:hypothetical protein BigBertha_150 [Bacillus phage BigBertha]YP_009055914.1 hypothetical protein LD11_gp149 [Bacillus phage Riley]YP_009206509.1 hypothetical protein AVV02_gp154 [Bacillus phage AvesoBmore]ASZ75881.1 hypothetical protein TAFFO16_148 [Bacillus phage Taffo16]ULF48774.1 hypothetical protein [Bacillus phage BillyBob]AGY46658.1 hypothetical protein BigBertha_150 [Bacillus phage BigBertha]AIF72025.1 hypothetical protein [Bacillus phage Riley]ALA13319.1 hypothetical protein AVESO